MKCWFCLLVLVPLFNCVAAAQTSDGISVPVSRSVTLTPDEAAITIVAGSSLDGTGQQVKQALQDAGLPNPTVVAAGLGSDNSTYPPGAAQILYLATVTIPAGSARDAARSLETLRTHLQAPLKSLQYSVEFHASQATVDAAWQVVLPQLLADARKQGQLLAAAAGVKLGAIRSISDSASGLYSTAGVGAIRNGDFIALLPGYLSFPAFGSQQFFSLSVIFTTSQ
jgi:hypothetical protein